MDPVEFYKCLAEETRLKSLLLITLKGELCVCDLMDALALSQPKVSRHLAELRRCGLLVDERRGKWVYYQLSKRLPSWADKVLSETAAKNRPYLKPHLDQLSRSQKSRACC